MAVAAVSVAATLAEAAASVDVMVVMEGCTQGGTSKHRHNAPSEIYTLPLCLGGTGTGSPRRSQRSRRPFVTLPPPQLRLRTVNLFARLQRPNTMQLAVSLLERAAVAGLIGRQSCREPRTKRPHPPTPRTATHSSPSCPQFSSLR